LLVFASADIAVGEQLAPDTVDAYERYVARLQQRFGEKGAGHRWIAEAPPEMRARLRAGEIFAEPGHEDGIIGVPEGLVHHWRGAAYFPAVTLDKAIAAAQDYPRYASTYEWVTDSALIGRTGEGPSGGDRFWVFLRMERSAGVVSSVLDVWALVDYWYAGANRATAVSDVDCVRQVEDAGEAGERRLPVGGGSGYLWRANTFSTYLEQDDGVYVELETVGLSRDFPPLLGWIIEPIARRLGRGSVSESLRQLRQAVADAGGDQPAEGPLATVQLPTVWCGG
jgi:hypothetical protein